jgi:hypothetical protein
VPERVRARSFVAGATQAGGRRSCCPEIVERPLDPEVTHDGDLSATQLGRDAFGVPVRGEAYRAHDLLDPDGVLKLRDARAARSGMSATRPPREYAACRRNKLRRPRLPSARAALSPCSPSTRTSRARSRTTARSERGMCSCGGRPPRVARNRDPGPS